MSNVKIVLNSDGIRELLKSDELAEVCEKKAMYMTRVTGMTYEADVKVGKLRVRAAGYSKAERHAESRRTDWPVCPKCGEAHYNCGCWRKSK